MKTATFSNGHSDRYQGKRDVRAAWMVVTPAGKILSGHSQDTLTAGKTAANTAASMAMLGDRFHYIALRGAAKWAHAMPMVRRELARTGFKTVKAHDAALAAARAAFVATCKIEVVAL